MKIRRSYKKLSLIHIFYKAVLIVCQGIRRFQNRYADLAEQMAAEEGNKRRKQELLLIASNCRQVPYEPARTYYEALQSYWFNMCIRDSHIRKEPYMSSATGIFHHGKKDFCSSFGRRWREKAYSFITAGIWITVELRFLSILRKIFSRMCGRL